MTTKLHLCITLDGHVVEAFLTAGNVSDIAVADELTADVVGCHVVEDRGYDSDDYRRVLESGNNIPVIPGRKHRKVPIAYDKALYRLRRRIEQLFGKIKENRRLAVRYEKSDTLFLTFIAFALIKTYL